MWVYTVNSKMTCGLGLNCTRVLNSCLCYYQKLARHHFNLSSWYRQGIYCIGYSVNIKGKVETIEYRQNRYYSHINIPDYFNRLIFGSKFYLQKQKKKNKNNLPLCQTITPLSFEILVKPNKGCQDFMIPLYVS